VEVLYEQWKAKKGDAGHEEHQVAKLTLLEVKSSSKEYSFCVTPTSQS